jgi:sorting nexin-4
MDNDDFANVSWQNDGHGNQIQGAEEDFTDSSDHAGVNQNNAQKGRGGSHLGPNVDQLDLAGVGSGVLHCDVSTPLKENDGTKDAFVSYLVTTNVSMLE